jgi:hypothetical protein
MNVSPLGPEYVRFRREVLAPGGRAMGFSTDFRHLPDTAC